MRTHAKRTTRLAAAALSAALWAWPCLMNVQAQEYTLTIQEEQAGHTFRIYQIFTGDSSVDEDGQDVLSNIKWGKGVSAAGQAALGDPAENAEYLSGSTLEEPAAKRILSFSRNLAENGYLSGTYTTVQYSADTGYQGVLEEAGYYLIVEDPDQSLEDGDAYTGYILQIAKETQVQLKDTKPTVSKKVKDTDDSSGTASGWDDGADYDIGDAVPFKITAVLGSDYLEAYDEYLVRFYDSLSKGLTLQKDSLSVTVAGRLLEEGDYSLQMEEEEDGTTRMVVEIQDVLQLGATKNSAIVLEYTALLNSDAALNYEGNDNSVYLEYSNDPLSTSLGKTTEDLVRVFTYSLDIDKTDGTSGKALAGAEFALEKFVQADNGKETYNGTKGNWVEYANKLEVSQTKTHFQARGLDAGVYRITETMTPEGYNTMDPVTFTISADHDTESDLPLLNGLSTQEGEMFSLDKALEAGGKLEAVIANYHGTRLPSTGGAGTTWLYGIGGVCMTSGLVWYITRKRIGA